MSNNNPWHSISVMTLPVHLADVCIRHASKPEIISHRRTKTNCATTSRATATSAVLNPFRKLVQEGITSIRLPASRCNWRSEAVYDSANVSLQGSAPEISGFPGNRRDVVGNPNSGPHTPDQWFNSAFKQLHPVLQAGQFGNAGRNIVNGRVSTVGLLRNQDASDSRIDEPPVPSGTLQHLQQREFLAACERY
jgi:hypothetical protein